MAFFARHGADNLVDHFALLDGVKVAADQRFGNVPICVNFAANWIVKWTADLGTLLFGEASMKLTNDRFGATDICRCTMNHSGRQGYRGDTGCNLQEVSSRDG